MWTPLGAIILPTQGVVREVNKGTGSEGKGSAEQVEPKVPVGHPGEVSIGFLPSSHQTLSTSHELVTGDIKVSTVFHWS